MDKKKAVIVAVALAVIIVIAAALWYFWKMKPTQEPYVPFTSEEKHGVLQDLSVPASSALPDAEKQKILEGLSAPPAKTTKSAGQPLAAPQVNDVEKLKLLESLKAQ